VKWNHWLPRSHICPGLPGRQTPYQEVNVITTISSRCRLVVSAIFVALAASLTLGAVQSAPHVTPHVAAIAAPAPGTAAGAQSGPGSDGTPWG
jgi:hypothetical protein